MSKTPGQITEDGLRNDISVGPAVPASWLGGSGAVGIFNLMEDAATAEISRSQIWQWIHNDVPLDDGRIGGRGAGRAADRRGAEQDPGGESATASTPSATARPRAVHRGRAGRRLRRLPDHARLRAHALDAAFAGTGKRRQSQLEAFPGEVVRRTATIQALVPRMRDICGPGNVITDPLELRTYECDGLTSHRAVPGAGRAARIAERGGRGGRCCASPGCRSSPAAPAPVCPAARCRASDGVLIVMSRMRADRRGRPGEPAGRGGAGRHQPGRDQGRGAVRPLLRARPVEPAGLLGRRQRRGELRRRALPEVRVHRPPRHRAGDRHPGRRADRAR